MRHVTRVQERAALEANVHERRLHAWHHALHPSAIDVADVAAMPAALDVDFLQHAVLDHADPRLARRHVDQDFLGHVGRSEWEFGKQSSMKRCPPAYPCAFVRRHEPRGHSRLLTRYSPGGLYL